MNKKTNRTQMLRKAAERTCRLSGDDIALMAGLYRYPYDSYGRLRAYIEEFDRLPPERFLRARSKQNVVDWQARPEDR